MLQFFIAAFIAAFILFYFTCAAGLTYRNTEKSFFNSIIHTYFTLFMLSQKKQTAILLYCSVSVYLLLFTASYYMRSPILWSVLSLWSVIFQSHQCQLVLGGTTDCAPR